MKRELRESQAQTDCLELSVVRARQEAKSQNEEAEANSKLMAARIQDLATKLSAAEKQVCLFCYPFNEQSKIYYHIITLFVFF